MSLLRLPDLNPTPPTLLVINHLESHKNLVGLLDQMWSKGQPKPQAELASSLQLGPFPVISYKSVDQLPVYGEIGQDIRPFLAAATDPKADSIFSTISPNVVLAMRSIPLGAIYLIEYPAEDPSVVLHTYYSSIVLGIQTLMSTFTPLGAVPLHIVLVPIPGHPVPMNTPQTIPAAVVVKDFLANLIAATRLPMNSFTNLASPFVDGQSLLTNILAMGRAFFIQLADKAHAMPGIFVQAVPTATPKQRSKICLAALIRRAFLLAVASFCDQTPQTFNKIQFIFTKYSLSTKHTAYLTSLADEMKNSVTGAEVGFHTAPGLVFAIIRCYEAILVRLAHHYELVGPSMEIILLLTAYLRLFGEIYVAPLHTAVSKALAAAQHGKEVHIDMEPGKDTLCHDFLYSNIEFYSYNHDNIFHTPIPIDSNDNIVPPAGFQTTPLTFNTYRQAFDTTVPRPMYLLAIIHALLKLLTIDYNARHPFLFGPQQESMSLMHHLIVNLSQIGLICEAIRIVSLALTGADSLVIPPNNVQTKEEESALHKELFKNTSLISVIGKLFPADLADNDTALLERTLELKIPEASKLHYIFPQMNNPSLVLSQRLISMLLWHRKSPVSFSCFGSYLAYMTPISYSASLLAIYSDLLTTLATFKGLLQDTHLTNQPSITAFIGFPTIACSLESQIIRELTKLQNSLYVFLTSRTSDGTTINTLQIFFTVLAERIARAVFDYASTKQGKLDASEKLIYYYTSISQRNTSSIASIKLLSYVVYAQLTTNVSLFLKVSSSSLLKKEISALLADTRKELINPATVYKTLNSCDMDLLRRQLTRRLDFLFKLRDNTSSELRLSNKESLSLLLESYDSYSMALACLEGRAMKTPYSPTFFIAKLLEFEELQAAGLHLKDADKATLKRLLQDIVSQAAALETPLVSTSFAYPIIISQLAWDQSSYSVGETAILATELALPSPILEIAAQLDLNLHVLIKGSVSSAPEQSFSIQTLLKCKLLQTQSQKIVRISLCKVIIPQNYNENTLRINSFKISYIWAYSNLSSVSFDKVSNQTIDYSDLIFLQARESRFSSVKFYLRRYKKNVTETIHKNTYCIVKCSENLCAYVRDPLQMVESGYCLSAPEVYAGKPFLLYLYLKAVVDVPPVSLIATYTCLKDTVSSSSTSPNIGKAGKVRSKAYAYINGQPLALTPDSPNAIKIGSLAAYASIDDLFFIPFIICANDVCHFKVDFALELGTKRATLAPRRGTSKTQSFEVAPQGSNNICAVLLHRAIDFTTKTNPVQTLAVSSNGHALQPLVLSQWTTVEITNRTHDELVIEDVILNSMPMGEVLGLPVLKQSSAAPGGKLGLVIKNSVGRSVDNAPKMGLFGLETYSITLFSGPAQVEDPPLCCVRYRSAGHYLPPKLRGTSLENYICNTDPSGPLLLTGVACHEMPTINVKSGMGCPFLVLVDKLGAKCCVNTTFEYICELSVQDTNTYTAFIQVVSPPSGANGSIADGAPFLEISSDKASLTRSYTLSPNLKISFSIMLRSTIIGLCLTPELHITLILSGQSEKKWNYVYSPRRIFICKNAN